MIYDVEAFFFAQLVRSASFKSHHFRHQLFKRDPGTPPQFGFRLHRITEERFHFCGPEVAGIDFYEYFPRLSYSFYALPFPEDFYPYLLESGFYELFYGILLTSGDNEVIRPNLAGESSAGPP